MFLAETKPTTSGNYDAWRPYDSIPIVKCIPSLRSMSSVCWWLWASYVLHVLRHITFITCVIHM